MRLIPLKLRREIADDPFMTWCVWSGDTKNVSWEHCWIYSGRQINEKWAIVPLRRDLNVNITKEIKDYCRWISLIRAKPKDLAKYPKKNWTQIKKFLDNKFLCRKSIN